MSLTADWSSLPESLWLNIFSKCNSIDLLTIKEVCSQWRRIAKDISLTSHLDLTSKPISRNLLLNMISFAENNIKSLKIRGHWNRDVNSCSKIGTNALTINEEVTNQLKNRCKQLKCLCLEDINDLISYESLPSNLIHLSINNCHNDLISILHSGTRTNQTLEKLKTIRCLDVSHFEVFDSLMCRELNYLISLKYLYMEGLIRVNDGGITHIKTPLMSQLVLIDLEGTDTKDESLQYILKNANALQQLYLGRTQVTGKIDFNQSVSTQLKVLCLINTLFDIESMQNLLRMNSTLTSVNCNDDIRQMINSPILTTKQNSSHSNNTCLHYKSHRCDKFK